ncbi:Crp/Fnr family transcriptional regulator [Saccharothrix sp. NPDC042600]|uniref:Crp/Fnr family transcriptional regulator n=1 Tax=Saccharothrix mutabilis subsp. mutabilis TaxID=66855 RepID=A0ABN0UGK3_9PSEU|nr:Crp/Fnr family transcriptional regulator [Saccharothrix mutabilis subsp. capreolus]
MSGVSLLERLSDRVAGALLELGGPVGYGSGEIVFSEGGEDGHAVLVLTGAVKVRATDEAGDSALLAVLSAGNLVGEMAALDGQPRSATVVACGAVTGRLIPQHQLLDFVDFHREVLVELFRVRADQVRWANELRRAMPHHAATRIARVLGHLVRHHGSRTTAGWTLDLPLTNVELASIAGMKSRTAEKAFSRLRDAGVVLTSTRRAVLVPDLPRLDLIAAGHDLP